MEKFAEYLEWSDNICDAKFSREIHGFYLADHTSVLNLNYATAKLSH